VRQHILNVMGNVTYYFVENLTGFSAVKGYWKSVLFDAIIVTRGWRVVFLGQGVL